MAVSDWPRRGRARTGWSEVVAGSNSFALKSDGTLWAWGDNAYGQLGLGDLTAYSEHHGVHRSQDFVDDDAADGQRDDRRRPRGQGRRRHARGAGGWTRTVRTIKVSATDAAGPASGRAQISLTGGVSYLTRKSVDGAQRRRRRCTCAPSTAWATHSAPKYLGRWKIDTTRPKPAALAASVKRGSTARLRYRIADYSPCVVKIAVKNARGVTVKSITVKGARPMTWLATSFRCTLAKGTYRWYVTATDSVGYKQVRPAVGKLIVK